MEVDDRGDHRPGAARAPVAINGNPAGELRRSHLLAPWTRSPELRQSDDSKRLGIRDALRSLPVSRMNDLNAVDAQINERLRAINGMYRKAIEGKRMDPEEAVTLIMGGIAPNGMRVSGNLVLHDARNLRSLPEWLTVDGNFEVVRCPNLKALPKGLTADLVACQICEGLREVPADLSARLLFMDGCPALVSLPEGLALEEGITLVRMKGFEALPQNLSVPGSLSLDDVPALARVGEGLSVGDMLRIVGAPALKALPDGLCAGKMDLRNCALESLPRNLTVDGPAGFFDLPGLTAWPEGLSVGGRLSAAETRLPGAGRDPATGYPLEIGPDATERQALDAENEAPAPVP